MYSDNRPSMVGSPLQTLLNIIGTSGFWLKRGCPSLDEKKNKNSRVPPPIAKHGLLRSLGSSQEKVICPFPCRTNTNYQCLLLNYSYCALHLFSNFLIPSVPCRVWFKIGNAPCRSHLKEARLKVDGEGWERKRRTALPPWQKGTRQAAFYPAPISSCHRKHLREIC